MNIPTPRPPCAHLVHMIDHHLKYPLIINQLRNYGLGFNSRQCRKSNYNYLILGEVDTTTYENGYFDVVII